MTETRELLNAVHNHLQKASSEAAAVEDLSVRRALLSLVEAVKLVTQAAKQTG